MAKTNIQFVYDKQTGEYGIICDMEVDTINLSKHNKAHKQFVQKLVGNDISIEILESDSHDSVSEEANSNETRHRIDQSR